MGLFIRVAAVFLLHFPVQLKDRNKRLQGKEFSAQKSVKAQQFRPAQKKESPAPTAHTLSRLEYDAVGMFHNDELRGPVTGVPVRRGGRDL